MSPSAIRDTPRTWLITGTSSGLGRELTLECLSRGDKVIAAGRDPSRLTSLAEAGAVTVKIDQNEALEQVKKDVDAAVGVYGYVDVMVLNAAYVMSGTLEERTPEETLAQYNTNVFGILNLYRAILPHMRERRSGVIATVGSMGSVMTGPLIGLYHSSKAAVRNLALTLHNEVSAFNIRSVLIEPGYFRTPLLSSAGSMRLPETRIDDYASINDTVKEFLEQRDRKQLGDPRKGAKVMFEVLTGTGCAQDREIPKLLALGSDAVESILKSNEEISAAIEEWRNVSSSTDYPVRERFY